MKILFGLLIWILTLIVAPFVQPVSAQDCAQLLIDVGKGDHITAPCDSLILVSKQRVRSAITFYEDKVEAIVRLSTDKDQAFLSLDAAHNARFENGQKQLALCEARSSELEKDYKALIDSVRNLTVLSNLATERSKKSMEQLEYEVYQYRKENIDFQTELRRSSRRNLFLGLGIGIGGGVGLAALIVVVAN